MMTWANILVWSLWGLFWLLFFSSLRVRHAHWLKGFRWLDTQVARETYSLPYSVNALFNQLVTFRGKGLHLEALTPFSFLLYDYREGGNRFFHPYYRVFLDEAKRGSQITVFRSIRAELIFSLLVLDFLITYGIFATTGLALPTALGMGVLLGLAGVWIASEYAIRPSLDALLASLGIATGGDSGPVLSGQGH